MSSISSSFYGTSTNKGVGGLMSGLDTDDLVKQMTAATRGKINRQYQSKQKLLYRQEAYREVSTKLLAFSNKYFSYSAGSKTNILSPKFFESYTFKSSSNHVNVTGNAENIKNFSINEIKSVATAASFTSSQRVSSDTIQSKKLTDYTSTIAGGTMTIEYNNKNYTISIDKGFGNTDTEPTDMLNDIKEQLIKQIGEISDLSDLSVSTKDNILSITSTDGEEVKLIAASKTITDNLKLELGKPIKSTSEVEAGKLVKTTSDIFKNENSYISFEYNGVVKTINFKDIDKANIVTGLQEQLNKAYGTGKVKVELDGDKILSFKVEDGSTNVFGISSISSDLGNFIDLESGDYNRINRNKPLAESGITGLKKVNIGDEKLGYKLNINGVELKFEETMSVTDIINKINSDAEVGVRVYYSSTTDTFTVKATETGSHKGISITADDSNLAQALFGNGVDINSTLKEDEYLEYDKSLNQYIIYNKEKKQVGTATIDVKTNSFKAIFDETDVYSRGTKEESGDYVIVPGNDTVMTYSLNGVENSITRSTANFSIDEINIELNEKAKVTSADEPITFDVTNNSDEVVARVKQFIDEYNEIISLIGTKTSEKPNKNYLPLTPEQQEEMKEEEIKNWNIESKKGVLYGDSKMNTVLRRMRSAMSGLTDVSSITLSSIGISSASMDTSGKLVLDEAKLKEKLLENPDEIANLFTLTSSNTGTDARSGIAIQLQQILRDNVGAFGTTGLLIEEAGMSNSMTSDSNFISEKMKEYDKKMEDLKKALEVERNRYWKQFSALESSLNKLNAQSGWLTEMMGQ